MTDYSLNGTSSTTTDAPSTVAVCPLNDASSTTRNCSTSLTPQVINLDITIEIELLPEPKILKRESLNSLALHNT